MLRDWTQRVASGQTLGEAEIEAVVEQLVAEAVSAEDKAAFLTALARKGETVAEIAAFARQLQSRAVRPVLEPALREQGILDVCGTGGDRLDTFNISTSVALVASASGVVVAKHGNRAITSQAGSADVLEALGVRVDLAPEEAVEWLRTHRFAFLFAPRFHPAFRHIAPARKLCAARGQRTLFNYLGPLLNPVGPTAQLIGVPRPELTEALGQVLQALGVRRGMVVCGRVPPGPGRPEGGWLDELSTLGETRVAEFYQDRAFSVAMLEPVGWRLQPVGLDDLRGGDRETNARLVRAILRGEDRGPRRDAVLLNAGAALFVAGAAPSITEGWERASAVIDSGRASAHLETLVAASAGSK